MKNMSLLILMMLSLSLTAEDAAKPDKEALKKEQKDLRAQKRELNKKIQPLKRKLAKDPDIIVLKKVLDAAQKAYWEKLDEKLKALEGGAALLGELDKLTARDKEIRALLKPKKKPKKDKKKKK
ncbi:MAG: hypothetical protein HRT89_15180 [Lentisphaeria bacterium]|nr:hypothetical protein [Lentisphaeria bacterium]NQZ69399.1 hypothetical protein [Lentisphaeria bacterium]